MSKYSKLEISKDVSGFVLPDGNIRRTSEECKDIIGIYIIGI